MTWQVAAEEARARLGRWFGTSASAPLGVAGEQLGLICCYRVAERGFTAEDQALLTTVAGHAALALKTALLAEELTQQNDLGHFLRDVAAGRLVAGALRERAAMLGLTAPSYTLVVGSVEFEAHAEPGWEGSSLVLRQLAHDVG